MSTKLFAVILALTTVSTCFSQQYFTEAGTLSLIKQENLLPSNKIKFKVLSGILSVEKESQTDFNAIATDITAKIKSIIPSPKSMDSVEQRKLKTELTFILFLTNNNDNISTFQGITNFPENFYFLESIHYAYHPDDPVYQTVQGHYKSKMNNPSENATNSVTNLGTNSFSEADIILGATNFILSRAKEELADTYIKIWYEKLDKDPVIHSLLPQTLGILKAFIDDNSLNLAKYGDKWKAAFQEDLRNIPLSLQNKDVAVSILNLLNCDSTTETYKNMIVWLPGGSEIIYNLYLKKNIVTILRSLAAKFQMEKDPVLFQRMVIFAESLSNMIGTFDDFNTYNIIKDRVLREMDKEAWIYLWKLFYCRNNDKMEKIFTSSSSDNFKKIVDGKVNAEEFNSLMVKLIGIYNSYLNILSQVNPQDQNKTIINLEDTRRIFDLTFQLFENTEAFYNAVAPNDETLTTAYKKDLRPFLINFSEMGEGLCSKDYGKVLDGFTGILRTQNVGSSLNSTITNVQKYGSFMVNVLTAKNSTDVSDALNELIPKNLYKLKGSKNFTVSISAYPGIFAGTEKFNKFATDQSGNALPDQPRVKTKTFNPSFFLPIGIDFNVGKNLQPDIKKDKQFSSINLFIQVLDLGAAMNYRLNNSDTTISSNPNISFKQFLSPGIYGMFHFINSPLTLGVGCNYTPSLRTVDQKGFVTQPNVVRVGVSLGVDVTFFHLHISKK